ncbi:acyl carrier protein [Halarcobacter mediterraneus]|uniref:Acyl carrier protein n=1 Tax=Halarcobacter mediterraneus TaxID=2023153 RepID=A0A4Q1AX00_9BACT|nr:acyl carrier protein [Halarcobacter mediterraneus]RXK13611.1 acyl carrier protein [Halarcobacter mediterraneus]
MEEKVIQIASDVFNCQIKSDSKIGNPEEWDSLGQLNLFMAIESELGIKCSADEIIENNSISSIVKLLESKK